MSDKPREWPNKARWARDDAAEEILTCIQILLPFDNDDVSLTANEMELRALRVKARLEKALRYLESVGACTRP